MSNPKLHYNVFLMDLPGLLTSDDKVRIATILKGYFDQVAHGAGYIGSSVTWQTACPVVKEEELLIYFVEDYRDSVLTRSAPPALGGLTDWRAETGSEVYIKDAGGGGQIYPVLANLAFHEALHNKTHLDNAGLHPKGGLAGTLISAATRMTPAVEALMTGALTARHRQFTGGCAGYSLPSRPYLVP